MVLNLIFSRSIEPLANSLCDALLKHSQGNPFSYPLVLVPNLHVRSWLILQLTDRLGVSFDIRCQLLERGLWYLLNRFEESLSGKHSEPISQRQLQLLIFKYLLKGSWRDSAGGLSDYLRTGNPSDLECVRRAQQLSNRLVKLFFEYEYHSPETMGEWLNLDIRRQPVVSGDGLLEEEQELFRNIFGAEGIIRKISISGNQEYATLPMLARSLQFDGEWSKQEKDLSSIHLFGFSHLSCFHSRLLLRISEFIPVYLYHLNWTPELWSSSSTDLSNISEEIMQRSRITSIQPSLNEKWGIPGRDFILLLEEIGRSHFPERTVALQRVGSALPTPTPGTLLQGVQEVLSGQQPLSQQESRHRVDGSLCLFSAASPRREVETIFNSIIRNLEEDTSLLLNDFAVLVTDMDIYRSHIDAVFNQLRIPVDYNLTDLKASESSCYASGVRDLLSLGGSRMSRLEVFQLLLNPCFMKKMHLSQDDIRTWSHWAVKLNIYHGIDSTQKSTLGDQGNASPLFTWKLAMQRLRLGKVMVIQKGMLPWDSYESLGEILPYEDYESCDTELLQSFTSTLENLFSRLLQLTASRGDGLFWSCEIYQLLHDYLDIPEDRLEEATIRDSLDFSLEDLKFPDFLNDSDTDGLGLFTFDEVREYIFEHLGSIDCSRGRYLIQGVTVSEIRPLRPIPFRIIYLLGLQEGAFPGKDVRSTLDCRTRENAKTGDLALPDINRGLFLETVLSARQKLYVSYVRKDLQKDENWEPCSLIKELHNVVEALTHTADPPFRIIETPLQSYSNLRNESADILHGLDANYSLTDRLIANLEPRESIDENALRAIVAKSSLSHLLLQSKINRDMAEDTQTLLSRIPDMLRIQDLRDFLCNPIENGLRRLTGWQFEWDETKDAELNEEEPFSLPRKVQRQLSNSLIQLVAMFGQDYDKWENAISVILERQRMEGELPEGLLAEYATEYVHDLIRQFYARTDPGFLQAFFAEHTNDAVVGNVVFGEAGGIRPYQRKYPCLVWDLVSPHFAEVKPIRISQEFGPIWIDDKSVSLLFLKPFTKTTPNTIERDTLIPFLAYAFLQCSEGEWEELFKDRSMDIWYMTYSHAARWSFAPDSLDYKNYLNQLFTDYFSIASLDLLPYRTAQDYLDPIQKSCVDPERFKSDFYYDMQNTFGFSESVTEDIRLFFSQRVPDDVLAKVTRRFMPIHSAFYRFEKPRSKKK